MVKPAVVFEKVQHDPHCPWFLDLSHSDGE